MKINEKHVKLKIKEKHVQVQMAEKQLKVMERTMDLRGIVRLYNVGSSGVLVGMEVAKIQGGYALRRDPPYVDYMASFLGSEELEEAKPAKTP